jgi:hypothetical protein
LPIDKPVSSLNILEMSYPCMDSAENSEQIILIFKNEIKYIELRRKKLI